MRSQPAVRTGAGDHSRCCLSRVLANTSTLGMIAVRTTLGAFPRSRIAVLAGHVGVVPGCTDSRHVRAFAVAFYGRRG